MTEQGVAKIIDSASILVLRDNDKTGALEVLMVKRHADIAFAGGAYVFPGGKVDPEDLALSQNVPSFPVGYSELTLTAFREVFEESGLIIGDGEGATEHRAELLSGELSFTDFIVKCNVKFNVEDLVPFARWVTPKISPKRFDTRFFLARAPQGQEAVPDYSEIVKAVWAQPIEFIDNFRGDLMFPTVMNLKLLGQASSVNEAMSLARARKIITVEPKWEDGGPSIDPDAGYGEIEHLGLHKGFKPINK